MFLLPDLPGYPGRDHSPPGNRNRWSPVSDVGRYASIRRCNTLPPGIFRAGRATGHVPRTPTRRLASNRAGMTDVLEQRLRPSPRYSLLAAMEQPIGSPFCLSSLSNPSNPRCITRTSKYPKTLIGNIVMPFIFAFPSRKSAPGQTTIAVVRAYAYRVNISPNGFTTVSLSPTSTSIDLRPKDV